MNDLDFDFPHRKLAHYILHVDIMADTTKENNYHWKIIFSFSSWTGQTQFKSNRSRISKDGEETRNRRRSFICLLPQNAVADVYRTKWNECMSKCSEIHEKRECLNCSPFCLKHCINIWLRRIKEQSLLLTNAFAHTNIPNLNIPFESIKTQINQNEEKKEFLN